MLHGQPDVVVGRRGWLSSSWSYLREGLHGQPNVEVGYLLCDGRHRACRQYAGGAVWCVLGGHRTVFRTVVHLNHKRHRDTQLVLIISFIYFISGSK